MNANYGFKAPFLAVDIYVWVFVGMFSRMASTEQPAFDPLLWSYIWGSGSRQGNAFVDVLF